MEPVGWLDVSVLCFMEWVQWKMTQASVAVINQTKQHLFSVRHGGLRKHRHAYSVTLYLNCCLFLLFLE